MGDETPIDSDSVRQLFKGGSIDFSGTLVSYAILFVGKAVLSRYLDVGDFGSVALGMTVMTIITTVALIGMKPGLTRFIPRMETSAERRDIVYSGLLIGLGATTLSAIVLYALAPILTVRLLEGSNLTAVIQVFAVSIPFFAFIRLMVGITRGYERVVPKVAIKQITLPITRLAAITIVSVFSLGAVAAAGAYLASFLIASVVGLFYFVQEADLRADAPFSPRVRELFTFSAPLALSGAVSMILSDVDVLMLGAFKTSSAVGLYEIAYTLGNLFTIVVSSIGVVFVPMMSRYHSNGNVEKMQSTYILSNKWTITATLPALLIAVSYPEQIISMTFGSKYTAGVTTFVLLAVGFSTHAVLGPNGGILNSIGATKIVLYANVVTAATNLVLNLSLIPRYGIFGAAIATVASYLLLNGLYQVTIYRKTGIVPFDRRISRPVLVGISWYLVLFTLFQEMFTPTIPAILGLVVVYSFSYALLQIRFGFVNRPEEIILESIQDQYGIPVIPVVDRIRSW